MKDLDQRDVAILRLGLSQVSKLAAAAREAAPGLPGLSEALADVSNRITYLREALDEPLNQLKTPPAKKTPGGEGRSTR